MIPLTTESRPPEPPPGWRWVLLTDLARLESGHTPSRRHPEWWDGDIPWLALPDIRAVDCAVVQRTAETINAAGIANSSARILPEDTVALSRTASVGFVTIFGRPMATSQDFVCWVCGSRLRPRFLMHLLHASRDYVRGLASGAIHKTVYVPTVKAFRVCIPSMEEQERVVAELDQQLDAAARMRAAAAQCRAFCGEILSCELSRVFFGEGASAWPRAALGQMLETCSGLTPSRSRPDYFGGPTPWVRTAELTDGTVSKTAEGVTKKALAETSLRPLPRGTLLVAMYGQGQTRGRTGLLGVEATVNQACFAILPKPTVVEPRFLQYWFRANYLQLRRESEGRGGSQPNLNGVTLRRQMIPVPDARTQRALVTKLDRVADAAMLLGAAAEKHGKTVESLSAALLRSAFQGVSGWRD